MVKSWRKVVSAAAISLVHANHIHARGQPFCGNAQSVAGIARAFEAVHDQKRECAGPVVLPMTMTEHGNTRLDFHQTFFCGRKFQPAEEEEISQRLAMAAAEQAARPEWLFGLQRPHAIILNRSSPVQGVRGGNMPIFEYVCKECKHEFEVLVFGKDKAECPKCHSKKLEPQLSVFAAVAKGESSSMPAAGPCGSCGDPRGPGACSMGDLD